MNRLINPSGTINQGGVGSKTDGTYDFDQWLTLTQTAAVTVTQLTNVENGTPFMMRSLQAQATAQRFGRIQWLESSNILDLRGRSVALSARVRMSDSTTLRYAIVEWTGTADVITKDIVLDWNNGAFTAGNFFTSTNTTVTSNRVDLINCEHVSNRLVDRNSQFLRKQYGRVFLDRFTQAQNVTLDIGNVQLEDGLSPTPFAWRPQTIELMLAQRYFTAVIPAPTMFVTGQTDSVFIPIPTTVKFLKVPSITHPLTDANFTNAGGATPSQWNLQSVNVNVASKTGTALFSARGGVDPGFNFLFISGCTFNIQTNAMAYPTALGPIKLDARL